MPEPTEIKNVPANIVGTKVQQFINTGATKIECVQQNDRNWTIRAS
jgi:hypothetical protein